MGRLLDHRGQRFFRRGPAPLPGRRRAPAGDAAGRSSAPATSRVHSPRTAGRSARAARISERRPRRNSSWTLVISRPRTAGRSPQASPRGFEQGGHPPGRLVEDQRFAALGQRFEQPPAGTGAARRKTDEGEAVGGQARGAQGGDGPPTPRAPVRRGSRRPRRPPPGGSPGRKPTGCPHRRPPPRCLHPAGAPPDRRPFDVRCARGRRPCGPRSGGV